MNAVTAFGLGGMAGALITIVIIRLVALVVYGPDLLRRRGGIPLGSALDEYEQTAFWFLLTGALVAAGGLLL